MKSEDTIFLVFAGAVVVAIPLLVWYINVHQEKEREDLWKNGPKK